MLNEVDTNTKHTDLAYEVFAVGAGRAVTLQAVTVPRARTHAFSSILLLTKTGL